MSLQENSKYDGAIYVKRGDIKVRFAHVKALNHRAEFLARRVAATERAGKRHAGHVRKELTSLRRVLDFLDRVREDDDRLSEAGTVHDSNGGSYVVTASQDQSV